MPDPPRWARSVASASRRSVCFRPAVEPMGGTGNRNARTGSGDRDRGLCRAPATERAFGNCERSTNAGKFGDFFGGFPFPTMQFRSETFRSLGRGAKRAAVESPISWVFRSGFRATALAQQMALHLSRRVYRRRCMPEMPVKWGFLGG